MCLFFKMLIPSFILFFILNKLDNYRNFNNCQKYSEFCMCKFTDSGLFYNQKTIDLT